MIIRIKSIPKIQMEHKYKCCVRIWPSNQMPRSRVAIENKRFF
jgi:hypothetical protein